MTTVRRWKPGASRRERSHSEHGTWVIRPYGTKARENRSRERAAWRKDERTPA
jgi:hypothetical protein